MSASSAASAMFAIPGDILTQTGGYVYDRRLLEGLRATGRQVGHIALGATFPDPTPEDTADAAEKLSLVPAHCPVIIDGLALGALDTAAVAAMSAPMVAMIHHPLAFEGGLDAGRREYLFQTERDNLRLAAHVIVPSPHTAEVLTTDYGVPENLITIAQPGTDQPVSFGQPVWPPMILSVGIQIPRKGHDVLLRALAGITDIAWQAVIAGSIRDTNYGATLECLRDDLGLADRVRLAGHVEEDELAKLYGQATVFALATRFEGYGMVFSEAMANGLPIVTCRTGAVSDTVASGAGVLVPPDDPDLFAQALRRVIQDSRHRHALADASAQAGALLDGWEQTAARVGAVLDSLQGKSAEKGSP